MAAQRLEHVPGRRPAEQDPVHAGMLVLYRVGPHIPAPGIDIDAIQVLRDRTDETGGALAFLRLFSGGALTQFAIFALGILPYITASIIMQILGVVIPRVEQWQQMGAVGQRKITQSHPVSDRRHRAASVDGVRVLVPQRWRRLRRPTVAAAPRSTCCPTSPPPALLWWC